MNYLILGGNGFIGSALTEMLADKPGNTVTVVDLKYNCEERSNVRFVQAVFDNVTDFVSITRGQDVVVHGISTTTPRSFHGMTSEISENLLPTIRLFDACIETGVKKILFLSSGGTVYGECSDRKPIDEDHLCKPICAYGMQKYSIELLLEVYKKQFGLCNYAVARIGNPYGPKQFTDGVGVISTFVRLISQGKAVNLIGSGNVIRDYIYIDDLTRALYLILNYTGPYSTFNVSYGQGHTVNEILEIIAKTMNVATEINNLPKSLSDVDYNVLDISRLCRETGFEPKVSLYEGIKILVEAKLKS